MSILPIDLIVYLVILRLISSNNLTNVSSLETRRNFCQVAKLSSFNFHPKTFFFRASRLSEDDLDSGDRKLGLISGQLGDLDHRFPRDQGLRLGRQVLAENLFKVDGHLSGVKNVERTVVAVVVDVAHDRRVADVTSRVPRKLHLDLVEGLLANRLVPGVANSGLEPIAIPTTTR